MQKIVPSLWFDKNCEEALNFYTSLFKNSKIVSIKRYPDGQLPDFMKGMEGKIITAIFELEGQRFMALDGGPLFKPNEAVSLYVECKDQEEVDYFWNAFINNGGDESQCGWLKDKYGFSWQIIPTALGEYLSDPDKDKSNRAMQAMLKMKKIVIADLEKAYNGN
jgi:predicted 3-demethylubiquinone-9 3-methyltransferase (glyoxalase superfamily)